MTNLPVELKYLPDSNAVSEPIRKRIRDIEDTIDLTSPDCALNYGADAQRRLSELSDSVLKTVRSKELGEIGDCLNRLGSGLEDIDQWSQKLGKKDPRRVLAVLKNRCTKAEKSVEKLSLSLQKSLHSLLRDIELMDLMYDANQNTLEELALYIAAGNNKLESVRRGDMAAMQSAADRGSLQDKQNLQTLRTCCDRFEKRLVDLHLTYTVCLQALPQLRMVQSSDTLMAQKLGSALNNTIPLWKSQMVIALSSGHTIQASCMAQQLTDMTNNLLESNGRRLRQAVLGAVGQFERPWVDIGTLHKVNQTLKETVDEVNQLRQNGQESRIRLHDELIRLGRELRETEMG